jgi:hypothetical protein
MRLIRPLSAGVAALAVAAGLTGPAVAQTQSGLGTSLSSTKVLTAQLGSNGSLLDLALLTDEAQATLDSAVAAPGSFSRLSLGKVSSSIVATDVVNKTLPSFEAKSTGPTSTDVTGGALGLAAPVLAGTVQGGKLTAVLENGIASSGLNAEVVNLKDVVGGLLSVASAKATLASQAAPDNSNATRAASINDITVLDLSAVLQGLGIDLGSLSIDQVSGLLQTLAATTGLDLPDGTTTLAGAVALINDTIDELEATIDAAEVGGTVDGFADDLVTTVGGLLGGTVGLPTVDVVDPLEVEATIELLQTTIQSLQDALEGLVSEGLGILDDLALLRLEGVEVGVATKAVQDVNASTATVTGKIGKVIVGNTTLTQGLDVLGAAATLTGAITQLNSTIGSVLAVVHPDLANLVKVSVLDKATEVATKNGYSTASAGVTALTATITPPAALADIVNTVNALSGDVLEVADVLGVAVDAVPAELGLSTVMSTLQSTLSLGFGALTQPASVKVAQVLSASNYRVGTATTTGAPGGSPTLPRTGGNAMLLTVAAAIIIGLAGRRILLSPEPKPVRVKK